MGDRDTARQLPLKQVIVDSSGGLNTKTFPTELQPNEFVQLQNFDVSSPGLLKKLEGYTAFGVTLATDRALGAVDFNSDNGVVHDLLWAFGTDVYSYDSSGNATLRASMATNDLQTEMLQALNLVYISNGTDNPVVLDASYAASYLPTANASVNTSLPPPFTTAAYANNRVFINDANNKTWLHYTGVLNDLYNQASDVFKFNEGSGDTEIVKIQQFRTNELIVFMNNRLEELVIKGDPSTDWFRQVIDERVGCAAKETVQEVGGTLFWLDQDLRVRAMNRTSLDAVQGTQAVPISDKLEDELESITKAHISKSVAGVFRNFYILVIPASESTEPNTGFIYDIVTQSWSGPHLNFSFTKFLESDIRNEGNDLFVGSSSESIVHRLFDDTFTANGASIESIARTPKYDFGQPEADKVYNEIEFIIKGSGGGQVKVEAQLDDEGFSVVEGSPFDVAGSPPAFPITLPIELSSTGITKKKLHLEQFERGRNIDFRITHNSTSDLQIIKWILTAQDENYEKENI